MTTSSKDGWPSTRTPSKARWCTNRTNRKNLLPENLFYLRFIPTSKSVKSLLDPVGSSINMAHPCRRTGHQIAMLMLHSPRAWLSVLIPSLGSFSTVFMYLLRAHQNPHRLLSLLFLQAPHSSAVSQRDTRYKRKAPPLAQPLSLSQPQSWHES